MAYALVCDQQYTVDTTTGAHVCPGTVSQMVIDPLVALDPSTAGTYLAAGFALGLVVFSAAHTVRVIYDLIKGA
ncbi:hypothetical protein [Mangrovitalea sediminis]|uniref:hypothetical protein n=1 Tax=Mangrovitalea sediminis TaxID=1982043 RepID=UPI000BE4E17B|nr:hypothetical protein [Mangrovitalea sediminis]